MREVSVS